jgi:hypothetical protein
MIALRKPDVHGQGVLVGPGVKLAALVLAVLLYLEPRDHHDPHRDGADILRQCTAMILAPVKPSARMTDEKDCTQFLPS